jgi:hypothetical protein
MLGLTLIQPMASAIVIVHPDAKRIENRPQNLPTKLRSVETVVAVHAGKKWDADYEATVYRILGVHLQRGHEPAGAVIGVMTLTGKVYTEAGSLVRPDRLWFSGPFGFQIKEARALAQPLPCAGALGFWKLRPELEDAVIDQLEHTQPALFPCGCSKHKINLGRCDQYTPGAVPG